MIKNVLTSLLITLCIVGLLGLTGTIESTYIRKGYIKEVKNNELIIIDYATENEWRYINNSNITFNKDDNIKMFMFNNHTDSNIYDDEIIKVVK